jgi:hypothetical protein
MRVGRTRSVLTHGSRLWSCNIGDADYDTSTNDDCDMPAHRHDEMNTWNDLSLLQLTCF